MTIGFRAKPLDRETLNRHLDEERRSADLLSEIREAMFGAQDGVTSILVVVSIVATATGQTYAVLASGIAAALAEVISMGAGEYMSSKAQREIFDAQIEAERREVADRPEEAEAEVALLFERDGLGEEAARDIAAQLATLPTVLLKTMVEKELGLTVEHGAGPLQGALILAGTSLVAAFVPMGPFFFLPVTTALPVAIVLSMVTMFVLGVFKARFTQRNPVRSGLEIVLLVAAAAAAGYGFGSILPKFLGVAGFTP